MARGGVRAGAGRPKGAPNKITTDLRTMILGALDDAGGQAYLCRQANENPGPFLALVGKVLPTTLAGSVSIDVGVELAKLKEAAERARSAD